MNDHSTKSKAVGKRGVPLQYVILAVLAVSFPSWFPALRAWLAPAPPGDEPSDHQIKDIVREVKDELASLNLEYIAKREKPLFLLHDFDLDLKFTVKHDDKHVGTVQPLFVVVSSEDNVQHERVQEIHLH